jgi:hypothetical protein
MMPPNLGLRHVDATAAESDLACSNRWQALLQAVVSSGLQHGLLSTVQERLEAVALAMSVAQGAPASAQEAATQAEPFLTSQDKPTAEVLPACPACMIDPNSSLVQGMGHAGFMLARCCRQSLDHLAVADAACYSLTTRSCTNCFATMRCIRGGRQESQCKAHDSDPQVVPQNQLPKLSDFAR